MSPLALAIGLLPLHGPMPLQGQVGVFDLTTIHSTPLEPEVIARTVEGSVVTEAIRYTAEPGVRPLMVLTYKQGLTGRPGIIFARKFGAEPRTEEAKQGFVGVSIAPPCGNTDPNRLDALGGPSYNVNLGWRQLFCDDPHQSLLYQNTLALTRAMDYLATRPEINLARSSVMGTDWAGTSVALLHAIDDRPASYFVWNSMGFYTDLEGNSGGEPSRISRDLYEKYSPAAYAKFGTKPIYVANSLNALESRFDALMAFATDVKAPCVLALAPNRELGDSNFKEFSGSATWQSFWSNPTSDPVPKLSPGEVKAVDGKLQYSCEATAEKSAVLVASFGDDGDWTGRTWQRFAMKKSGGKYVANLPAYDLEKPIYVFAQATSEKFGAIANSPIAVVPQALGVTTRDAFPKQLLRQDSFYVSTGVMTLARDAGATKPWARILPHWDGRIRIRNVQPSLWAGAKELVVTVKGDGTQNTLNVYFGIQSRDQLDDERQNYTMKALLADGETLGNQWKTFTIPLNEIYDLERVDSIFFETGGKPLLISDLSWR